MENAKSNIVSLNKFKLFEVLKKNSFVFNDDLIRSIISLINKEFNLNLKFPLNKKINKTLYSKLTMLKRNWKKLKCGKTRIKYKTQMTNEFFKIELYDITPINSSQDENELLKIVYFKKINEISNKSYSDLTKCSNSLPSLNIVKDRISSINSKLNLIECPSGYHFKLIELIKPLIKVI